MTFDPLPVDGLAPFNPPLVIPAENWDDAPLVCIRVNETWATHILGACFALLSRSAWNSTDKAALLDVRNQVRNLMNAIAALEDCVMPVQFRVDPDDSTHWEYSNDGGTTWLDGPLTTYGTPSDAVITDPASLLRNTIDLGSTGYEGLVIKALATVGVELQKGGVAAFFQKIPGLGLAADAVVKIAGTNSYDNPLLEVDVP